MDVSLLTLLVPIAIVIFLVGLVVVIANGRRSGVDEAAIRGADANRSQTTGDTAGFGGTHPVDADPPRPPDGDSWGDDGGGGDGGDGD